MLSCVVMAVAPYALLVRVGDLGRLIGSYVLCMRRRLGWKWLIVVPQTAECRGLFVLYVFGIRSSSLLVTAYGDCSILKRFI
jgi:hypothetical protein